MVKLKELTTNRYTRQQPAGVRLQIARDVALKLVHLNSYM